MPVVHSRRFADLTGHRFGRWTVIKRVHHGKCNTAYWLCRCDCGSEWRVQGGALKGGHSRKCRHCAFKARRSVKVGQRFGKWTVIGEAQKKNGYLRYQCRCDCGTIKGIAGSSLKRGTTTRCSGCRWIADNPDARSSMWHRITSAAAKRSIPLFFDKDYAFRLLESQGFRCSLSGIEIGIARRARADERGGSTASLDRIDSTKPYEVGNVQWVHKDINRMKQHFSQERFITWCRRVVKHNAKT